MNLEILSNLIITKMLLATNFYTEKNNFTKRENRPCWAVIIKYEGKTEYLCNGKKYISDINNITILPKGCTYEWRCVKPGRWAVIEFDSDTTCNQLFSFNVPNGESFLKHFKKVENKRAESPNACQAETIRDTYSIILSLISSVPKHYAPSEKLEKIQPALNYIIKNYNRPLKNDYLAQLTGLSTVYFRKLFCELTGSSPISYIHQMRTKKAKEMLESDYSSITDIAYSLGYSNIYDFSRSFKKHAGLSPTQYEKQLRK